MGPIQHDTRNFKETETMAFNPYNFARFQTVSQILKTVADRIEAQGMLGNLADSARPTCANFCRREDSLTTETPVDLHCAVGHLITPEEARKNPNGNVEGLTLQQLTDIHNRAQKIGATHFIDLSLESRSNFKIFLYSLQTTHDFYCAVGSYESFRHEYEKIRLGAFVTLLRCLSMAIDRAATGVPSGCGSCDLIDAICSDPRTVFGNALGGFPFHMSQDGRKAQVISNDLIDSICCFAAKT
jgi:hypothetical protein